MSGNCRSRGVEGVDVGVSNDTSAVEGLEPVSQLAFAAGGQPQEFRKEAGTDDGGFLGLNQADGCIRSRAQEMLAEEALGELPGFRKVATLFEAGMHPVHGDGGILDSVASLGIVADNLAGAAVAALVYLVEDGGEVFGDADAVLAYQTDDGLFVEERLEELQEEAARVEAESPADDVIPAEEVAGTAPRGRHFDIDPDVRGVQADNDDYRNSGWDRGHMVPAGDMKLDDQMMRESFYFSNICPQNRNLNGGDWKTLEELCRIYAQKYGKIYIVCGPVIGNNMYGRLGPHL